MSNLEYPFGQAQSVGPGKRKNDIKVKRYKDNSKKKVVIGDRLNWKSKEEASQTKTKYRRDGTKKKEVYKKVVDKDRREGVADIRGTRTKYDKEGKSKGEKKIVADRLSPKLIIKDTLGYVAASTIPTSVATVPLVNEWKNKKKSN